LQILRNSRFADFDSFALVRIVISALTNPDAAQDAARVLQISRERSATGQPHPFVVFLSRQLAWQYGRPAEAGRLNGLLLQLTRNEHARRSLMRDIVYAGIYWDGDLAAAAAVVKELMEPALADTRLRDMCAGEQWRISRADINTALASAALLERTIVPADSFALRAHARACAALIHALLAERSGSVDTGVVDVLHRYLTEILPDHNSNDPLLYAGNLAIARLHEQRGDLPRALAAVRRHGYGHEAGGASEMFLTTFLAEEARLASRLGDLSAARQAIAHYRALRSNPEPSVKPAVSRLVQLSDDGSGHGNVPRR
jgi:hypothetical protein